MREDTATAYIELGLRLGRHVENLVDSYYGPPEISERIDAEEPREPTALVEDAVRLREAADDSWLAAQLGALETVARKLAGEDLSYEEEVERYYGIQARRVPEEELEEVHRRLDAVLPGTGSLAERYQAWRERGTLSGESLARVVEGLSTELRARTSERFGLPDGESVDLEYVTDEPWVAYNYYRGDLRSRVSVNTDSPLNPTFLVHVVAHETYPGHHTEHAWKEQRVVREQGRVEETIALISTPQSLVAEGIAELAVKMALGDEEQEVTAKLLEGTGMPYDPDVSREVQAATESLNVGGNVAHMLHSEGRSLEEARDYLMRWGLTSPERADQALRFIADPTWRSYSITYAEGYRLCRDWVDGDPERFKRLLTEQLTPAELR
jgi:hypothetical protein